MNQRIRVVVKRASHVHQVPHTGRPHSEPVTSVIVTKSTPSSAAASASRSHHASRRHRNSTLEMKTIPRAAYAVSTAGTCRYMMRWGGPWNSSVGARTSAHVRPNSMRVIPSISSSRTGALPTDTAGGPRSFAHEDIKQQQAGRGKKHIKGPQELQLSPDGRKRLPIEDSSRGAHRSDERRQHDGKHEDRQQC